MPKFTLADQVPEEETVFMKGKRTRKKHSCDNIMLHRLPEILVLVSSL